MTNFSVSDIDDFSFHNQFWLLAAYLFGFNLSIQSNQNHSKLLLKILVTHNMKNVISLKVLGVIHF
jgi:hypothetical protein